MGGAKQQALALIRVETSLCLNGGWIQSIDFFYTNKKKKELDK
jgi:hypothetical protein